MMKVIFLDVDGVLNTDGLIALCWERTKNAFAVGKEQLELLKRIHTQTQAEIVLTSDWRLDTNWPSMAVIGAALNTFDMTILDTTPDFSFRPRVEEIDSWLNSAHRANQEIESFVILDDRADAGSTTRAGGSLDFSANFIRTDPLVGLTLAQARQAIAILNHR